MPLKSFMLELGRTDELNLAGARLTDSGAEAGRVLFLGNASRCNLCHSNGGANRPGDGNFNFNTGTELIRIARVDSRGIPNDGGFGGQGLAQPNFDTDGDGINDAFGNGSFNTPPLVEAADTAPFFHTHAFATVESAVEFYNTTEFNQSPAGQFLQGMFGSPIALSDTEVAQIGRFLRVINVAFNTQMALQRLNAAGTIDDADLDITHELLDLSVVEIIDGVEVLRDLPDLDRSALYDLRNAQWEIGDAKFAIDRAERQQFIARARVFLEDAYQDLGTGLDLTMGAGNLMF